MIWVLFYFCNMFKICMENQIKRDYCETYIMIDLKILLFSVTLCNSNTI